MNVVALADQASVELGLLNEDPSGYAEKLGLPVDLCEMTDTELISEGDYTALTIVCVNIF
jgi:hypothetical protein